MIVVMTDGHAVVGGGPEMRGKNVEAFGKDLLEDVMPLVESIYRTKADREHRAIVGLSMGGGQSLTVGLNHLDRFAWVGGFSSAIGASMPAATCQAPGSPASSARPRGRRPRSRCSPSVG